MKRFFASDAESDMLIAEATKTFGLKIGDIINMAIKNQFLPITEPFRTEARFILQRHTEGALEAQEIKQSMTRGIRALGTRPVRDADRLQGFFARYHLHEDVENCTITENDALWESAVEVYNILGKQISAGGISKINGARLVDGVCIIADRASKRTMIALIGFKSLPADGLADGVAVLTKEIAELPERGIFRLQCAVCIAVFRPQHHFVGGLQALPLRGVVILVQCPADGFFIGSKLMLFWRGTLCG